MVQLHIDSTPRWGAALLAIWLLLPVVARAQTQGPTTGTLYPWQTVIFNAQRLYTDCGRVRFSIRFHQAEYSPMDYSDTKQWTAFADAAELHYPIDEWGAQYLNICAPTGGVESVLRPNTTTPTSTQRLGNWRSGNPDDRAAWFKAVRWRPPVILAGLDQVPINAAAPYVLDANLPSNQAVFIIDQNYKNQDGLSRSRTLYALDNMNLDRSLLIYEKTHHKGEWSRMEGSGKDSVVYMPPGQVLSEYSGWRWMPEHSRSILMWRQSSNHAPWSTKLTDDYYGTIEYPSRYLTAADAARAAKLQMTWIKDGYAYNLNDWDGSRFDDTGNPYLGPQFTAGDVARETGEFIGDGMVGEGYIYFDRPDGDHSTDWFSPVDPANSGPTGIFWGRYNNSAENTNRTLWGGVAGYWNYMKKVEIEKGNFVRDYFAGVGANVGGIQWTGVTQSMIEGVPGIPVAAQNDGMPVCYMIGGPVILKPGDAVERMLAVAIADLPRRENVELGKRYLKWMAQQKAGVHPNGDALPASVVPLTDTEKWHILEGIKDSVFSQYDRGFAAFHGGPGSGLTDAQKLAGEGLRRYPDPPPAPDIYVSDGPGRCDVMAWYPDEAMFDDADTGVDDFRGWRVYRKQGEPWVNYSPELQDRGYRDWELIAELRADGVFNASGQAIAGLQLDADHYNREFTFNSGETRRVVHFGDVNVVRGEPYYYAVTAVDNGSQAIVTFKPGESLEGPRAQAATAIGGVGVSVTAFAAGISPNSNLSISGSSPVSCLGATQFALSQDALFDVNISRGASRAVGVTVSAASTADNVTIDNLVSDIQSAINAAVGSGKVTVGNTSVGKAATTAAVEYTLTFAAVEQNVVLGISGVNAATRNELGVNGGQTGRFVVVSPNPWSLDLGAGLSSDQNQIFFDNLPPLCTLKIFTETGDLVRTIDHISGSGQEVWYQVNENAQLVKSGLYILAVVNAKDADVATGLPTDDLPDQFVKFVIIR